MLQISLDAKEIEPTKEWQLLGENDTIPAGMHVRMDMTTGEKWVKLMDDDDDDDDKDGDDETGSSKEASSSASVAIINEDGSVQLEEETSETSTSSSESSSSTSSLSSDEKRNFDFEMMHRTLSKLPPEEQERIGGLPEIPLSNTESTDDSVAKKKRRELFEQRMIEIWQRRQEELRAFQESTVVDLPDLLKDRIKDIDSYLKDPIGARNQINLDISPENVPEGVITDILSALNDLEFHLTDVDMARDFHTLGGWPLLASLVAESSHVPSTINEGGNSTTVNDDDESIRRSSSSTKEVEERSKIMKIRALAAWCMGTAVKNTGEFSMYATEPISLIDAAGVTKTTPIDLLIDVFLETNLDDGGNPWEVRNLQAKTLYAISSMLRGNRAAQAHVIQGKRDGLQRLGEKYNSLVVGGGASGDNNRRSERFTIDRADIKLLTRLASLSSDIVEEVLNHPELVDLQVNKRILDAVSTGDWCDATCQAVQLDDGILSMNAKETMIKSLTVLAQHCAPWNCDSSSIRKALEDTRVTVVQHQADYDADDVEQIKLMIQEALDTATQ